MAFNKLFKKAEEENNTDIDDLYSLEDVSMSEIGYTLIKKDDVIKLLADGICNRVGSEDPIVGVYYRNIEVKYSMNKDTKTVQTIVFLLEVPFRPLYLNYEYNDRPKYMCELLAIIPAENGKIVTKSWTCKPMTLNNLCSDFLNPQRVHDTVVPFTVINSF